MALDREEEAKRIMMGGAANAGYGNGMMGDRDYYGGPGGMGGGYDVGGAVGGAAPGGNEMMNEI
jgi:hypothetical protein